MTHRPRTPTPALTALAALAAVAATGLLAAPAHASGGSDRVIRTGTCSDGARWKIKAKADDGRIEVESEVDSNTAGQQWTWRLVHDGDLSARGTARTAGRSGSFSVSRRVVDRAGSDDLVFRATHAGQVCVAKVSY